MAVSGHRGHVIGSGLESPDRPPAICAEEQRRRLTRIQGNLKAVEGYLQALTKRFDIGLFTGPAVEKRFNLQLRRQRTER